MYLVMVLLVGLGVDLAVRLVEECVIAFVLLVGGVVAVISMAGMLMEVLHIYG